MTDKAKTKFVVDIIMFIDFLVVALSGAVLKFVYPAGKRSVKAGVKFLFGRFEWLTVHDISVLLLVILLLVHLMLNWAWIRSMFGREDIK